MGMWLKIFMISILIGSVHTIKGLDITLDTFGDDAESKGCGYPGEKKLYLRHYQGGQEKIRIISGVGRSPGHRF